MSGSPQGSSAVSAAPSITAWTAAGGTMSGRLIATPHARDAVAIRDGRPAPRAPGGSAVAAVRCRRVRGRPHGVPPADHGPGAHATGPETAGPGAHPPGGTRLPSARSRGLRAAPASTRRSAGSNSASRGRSNARSGSVRAGRRHRAAAARRRASTMGRCSTRPSPPRRWRSPAAVRDGRGVRGGQPHGMPAAVISAFPHRRRSEAS